MRDEVMIAALRKRGVDTSVSDEVAKALVGRAVSS